MIWLLVADSPASMHGQEMLSGFENQARCVGGHFGEHWPSRNPTYLFAGLVSLQQMHALHKDKPASSQKHRGLSPPEAEAARKAFGLRREHRWCSSLALLSGMQPNRGFMGLSPKRKGSSAARHATLLTSHGFPFGLLRLGLLELRLASSAG